MSDENDQPPAVRVLTATTAPPLLDVTLEINSTPPPCSVGTEAELPGLDDLISQLIEATIARVQPKTDAERFTIRRNQELQLDQLPYYLGATASALRDIGRIQAELCDRFPARSQGVRYMVDRPEA